VQEFVRAQGSEARRPAAVQDDVAVQAGGLDFLQPTTADFRCREGVLVLVEDVSQADDGSDFLQGHNVIGIPGGHRTKHFRHDLMLPGANPSGQQLLGGHTSGSTCLFVRRLNRWA